MKVKLTHILEGNDENDVESTIFLRFRLCVREERELIDI